MRTIKAIILFSTVLTVLVSTGCASIQKASPAEDIQAQAFTANPNSAQVYVYLNVTLGAALSMPVTVDGKLAGTTEPKSFFKFDLPAGKHTLTSQGDKSTLELTTKNGEIYYVWQEVKMGMMSGGSMLQVVDNENGLRGVK